MDNEDKFISTKEFIVSITEHLFDDMRDDESEQDVLQRLIGQLLMMNASISEAEELAA